MRARWQGLLGAISVAVGLQLVPYGRDRANPVVVSEPVWDRPRTRELFFRACGDCHSHETEWPWYSFVAPAAWLVEHDVREARSHFNVSDPGVDDHGDDAAKLLRQGDMPPWRYRVAQPEARLSDRERQDLVAGLVATFGDEESGSGHSHSHARSHSHD
jgi:mono/diheme cytochrome c family protein